MGKQMVTFDQSRWKRSGDAFYAWEHDPLAAAVASRPLSVDTVLWFYKSDVRAVTYGQDPNRFELLPQDVGADPTRRNGFYDLTIPQRLPRVSKAYVLIEACAHGFYRVAPSQDTGAVGQEAERLLKSDKNIPDRLLERVEILTPGQPALFSPSIACFDMTAPAYNEKPARNGFGLIRGGRKDVLSQGLEGCRLLAVERK